MKHSKKSLLYNILGVRPTADERDRHGEQFLSVKLYELADGIFITLLGAPYQPHVIGWQLPRYGHARL